MFGDTANSGTLLGENPVRANYTGQAVFGPGTRTSDAWFNPAAFSTPAAFTFGSVGRNTVYGPGLQTLDLALQREFSLTEKLRFQFRAEFFNAFNHAVLGGNLDATVQDANFGIANQTRNTEREIQFALKLYF